jgi:hypothetical protein
MLENNVTLADFEHLLMLIFDKTKAILIWVIQHLIRINQSLLTPNATTDLSITYRA